MTAVPVPDADDLVSPRDLEGSTKRVELVMIVVGAVLVLIALLSAIF
jgi:hypothetical protein